MGTSGRIGFADSGRHESVLPTSPAVCTVESEVVRPNGGGAPAGEDQKATPSRTQQEACLGETPCALVFLTLVKTLSRFSRLVLHFS